MNKLPNLPLVQERFYYQIKDDLETLKIKYPEFEVLGVFMQQWGSTALGFGGWGGQAITGAYTTVIENSDTGYVGVFFGERLAYIIKRRNDKFYDDLMHREMKPVSKYFIYEKNETVSCEDMKLINRYSRRELSAEEVYVFPVILCDNERDRDGERFSISALKRLAELFVGKTGIFDHDPKGANQTARIYSAETVSEPERRTAAGEVYTYVKAWAYLMKSDKNADFIRDIDDGIKKEVSVSCSVKRRVCSICGSDKNAAPCSHVKGGYYGGKVCEVILDEPTDAYEWSFVKVPVQRKC